MLHKKPTDLLVVAYLFNTNGMASWCWEAASALQENGRQVLLACSQSVALPENCELDIVRFDPAPVAAQTVGQKVKRELERLSEAPSDLLPQLHHSLNSQGIMPRAYILNSTAFQNPDVATPQYVCGWAYPTSLRGYLSKIGTYAGGQSSRTAVRATLSTIGWYRKDWRAYRSATGVMSVSERLAQELTHHNVRTKVVHPGTYVQDQEPPHHRSGLPKIIIASLNLEEPRKRVRWMIQALKASGRKNFSLTLVGNASDAFKEWVCRDGFPATFQDAMPRAQVQAVMAEHDVFLFGSCLDDWGYVLIEAMGQGLSVVAPNLSPFDEIVGNSGLLFSANSREDFRNQVQQLITSEDLSARRTASWQRARDLFSRQAFGRSLLAATGLEIEITPASFTGS